MGKNVRSTKQQRAAVETADSVHPWPEAAGNCTEAEYNIFAFQQAQRSYDDWTPADLFELARISRIQAMAVEEFEKLFSEGLITYGGKTGFVPIENPRNRALNTLNSTINSTLRRLGITSMSVSEKRTQANRGQQSRETAAKIGNNDSDEFDGARLM